LLTFVHAELVDTYAIVELLEELDRFYGGTEFAPVEERAEELRAMIFRERPAAYVLLAKDDQRVIGLASYSYLWPAIGLTQSLYLKELYVRSAHRRQGVGRRLMERLLEIAAENQCSRLEWTTDRDNPLALTFYTNLQYAENPGKVLYRVEVHSGGGN